MSDSTSLLGPSLGTNVDGVTYYSSGQPFLDLFKFRAGAGGWSYPSSWAVTFDADGWVTSLPTGLESWEGVHADLLVENPGAPPHARYVVLYEGEGTLSTWGGTEIVEASPGRMVVLSGADGSVRLNLIATDPAGTGDYIRDIHVVEEKHLPLFEAGLNLDPDWVARVEDLHTLRFMDWGQSNTIYDKAGNVVPYDQVGSAPLLDWADRPQLTDAAWHNGIPVEMMVDLSNRTGTDMWVNMPVNASDDFVRGFAAYVAEHLDPGLKVHVEYSNEVWNWGFPQSHYAEYMAKAVLGPDSNFREYYGMRAAQIGEIWNEAFGEAATGAGDPGRAIIVYATQAAWKGLEEIGLETPHWTDANGAHVRAADYFDEYAITGYYAPDVPPETLLAWSKDPLGVDKALAAIEANINGPLLDLYRYHDAAAARYGLELATYESGPHINTPASMIGNAELTAWLIELNRRPEFYQFEQQNYENFRSAGGGLFLNFGIISQPTKWGSWGALETTDQASSPRYDALVDYSASHDAWWEQRDPATFDNARHYIAGDGGETIAGTAHGYDVLVGGAGDDVFVLAAGARGETIDGRGGNDTIRLPGQASAYTFTQNANGTVQIAGPDASATIANAETMDGPGGRAPLAVRARRAR